MPVKEKSGIVEKKWSDKTMGKSYFEGLNVSGDRVWERCEVLVHGHKNKITGCHLSVLVDGKPMNEDRWYVIKGTDQHRTVVEIHKKATVDVAGYITNHEVVGAGADIELKCYGED